MRFLLGGNPRLCVVLHRARNGARVTSGPAGILRRLIRTRHGFHIVAVDRLIPGTTLPFKVARARIAERLLATVQQRALRQYVSVLAGQARIEGVDLGASATPRGAIKPE